MQDTVANHFVKYLENRGVEHIFGLCGHTNIAVMVALEKSSIQFINVRHEQVAAHAADGYSRTKRGTGVVMTHVGPGMTNAVTGVATAALDCIPMVVIAGDYTGSLLWKAPPSGNQSAHGRRPVRNISPLCQEGLAGRTCGAVPGGLWKRPLLSRKTGNRDLYWWMYPWIFFPWRWMNHYLSVRNSIRGNFISLPWTRKSPEKSFNCLKAPKNL